jgi:probable F420-dependent oxidoreductase
MRAAPALLWASLPHREAAPVVCEAVKVRIGFGPGPGNAEQGSFEEMVDALEHLGFDSLWLSERATAPSVDPLVGLAVAAGRTKRIKLGTSVLVLPGRNPVLLAKQIASVDRLSAGRMLPAFGLGVADEAEQQAFGVARAQRAAWVDEALPLLRMLWTGEEVVHHGARFDYSGLRLSLTPFQRPLDVWLGGAARSELRRVARLADGWLPSFVTPDGAASGRAVIESEATACGRRIDPEHFGALLFYARDGVEDEISRRLAARRPGVSPRDLVAFGVPALRARVEAFIERGFSKFVVVPVGRVRGWAEELDEVAAGLIPLQSPSASAKGRSESARGA